MSVLGDRIKAARKKTGLSQEKFAEKFHVSAVTVSNWERGGTVPRVGPVLAEIERWLVSHGE
jgi:DNA-binding transcriptional regulator YiaG